MSCKCCCHNNNTATITVETRINGGPPSPAGTFTVTDGMVLTIMQPVEVYFAPGGPPVPHMKRPWWSTRGLSPTKQS